MEALTDYALRLLGYWLGNCLCGVPSKPLIYEYPSADFHNKLA
jgi:hypothetical protein